MEAGLSDVAARGGADTWVSRQGHLGKEASTSGAACRWQGSWVDDVTGASGSVGQPGSRLCDRIVVLEEADGPCQWWATCAGLLFFCGGLACKLPCSSSSSSCPTSVDRTRASRHDGPERCRDSVWVGLYDVIPQYALQHPARGPFRRYWESRCVRPAALQNDSEGEGSTETGEVAHKGYQHVLLWAGAASRCKAFRG